MVLSLTTNKSSGAVVKRLITAMLALALALSASQASATEGASNKSAEVKAPVIVKSLTDYPGRVRTVTETQKAEIRAVISRLDGNTKFICTGARLASNPYGMNIAVRMRAKLVCEYAKSLRPDLSYWYQTKVTTHNNFNGRVIVVSK